jgi:hypothetical protein
MRGLVDRRDLEVRLYKTGNINEWERTARKIPTLRPVCVHAICVVLSSARRGGICSIVYLARRTHWHMASCRCTHRQASTRSRQYDEGDERLLGRLFTFAPTAITTNTPDASRPCLALVVASQTITAGALFHNSFARRLTRPEYVSPGDFDVHVQPSRNVSVVSVECGNTAWNSGIGADEGLRGSWLILQSQVSAIMHWYDDTLLVLNRVRKDAIPTPSFKCVQARVPAEEAICHSLGLALLDRSVAALYGSLWSSPLILRTRGTP